MAQNWSQAACAACEQAIKSLEEFYQCRIDDETEARVALHISYLKKRLNKNRKIKKAIEIARKE